MPLDRRFVEVNNYDRILTLRMVPTICVAEFPMVGTTVRALTPHRRGRNGSSMKRRRFALKEMLRTGTIVVTLLPSREHCLRRLTYADAIPNCSIEADRSEKHPTNEDKSYKKFVAKRKKDLLSIVIRTIILVRRNHILQKRLEALQAETQRFLSSVLNNPECQQRRSHVPSHSENSSSTEKAVSMLSPPPDIDPMKNSFHGITSDNRNCTDDESSSSDKSEDLNRSEC